MAKTYSLRHIARIWSEDHHWSEETFYHYLRYGCKMRHLEKPYRLTEAQAQRLIERVHTHDQWTGSPFPSLDYAHCLKCGKGLLNLSHLCDVCKADETDWLFQGKQ